MQQTLEAMLATSQGLSRGQIAYDTTTGLILDVGNLGVPKAKLTHWYPDEVFLFAGVGDIHIHGREDVSGLHLYKEDYQSLGLSAINGGVSFLCDMPNNPVPPIDAASYKEKMKLTTKCGVPLHLYAGVGPHTHPLPYRVPYKVYMGPSVGELYFQNSSELREALKRYAGESISFHCEDPEILEESKGNKTHEQRRPAQAEVMATDLALELIEEHQLQGKLCHYSTDAGLKQIRKYREKSPHLRIEIEVTPQHLYFTESSILKEPVPATFFQMNPPIRSKRDQEGLWEALLNGEIEFLATDHAPHSWEEKQKGTSGLTGLDTFGPFMAWMHLEKKVPLELLCKMTAENPGSFINRFLPDLQKTFPHTQSYGRGFGFLKKDFVASFTLLNLSRPVTITKESLKTKAQWNPFVGHSFPGSVEAVFIQGKLQPM